jgi:hypothetical protein
MLYQLRNGKVIEMSVEQYLDCTDEDLQYLMCLNAGDVVEDPFFGSSINSTTIVIIESEEIEIEEIDPSEFEADILPEDLLPDM